MALNKNEIRIVVMGPGNSGKSAIANTIFFHLCQKLNLNVQFTPEGMEQDFLTRNKILKQLIDDKTVIKLTELSIKEGSINIKDGDKGNN